MYKVNINGVEIVCESYDELKPLLSANSSESELRATNEQLSYDRPNLKRLCEQAIAESKGLRLKSGIIAKIRKETGCSIWVVKDMLKKLRAGESSVTIKAEPKNSTGLSIHEQIRSDIIQILDKRKAKGFYRMHRRDTLALARKYRLKPQTISQYVYNVRRNRKLTEPTAAKPMIRKHAVVPISTDLQKINLANKSTVVWYSELLSQEQMKNVMRLFEQNEGTTVSRQTFEIATGKLFDNVEDWNGFLLKLIREKFDPYHPTITSLNGNQLGLVIRK